MAARRSTAVISASHVATFAARARTSLHARPRSAALASAA